MKVGIPVKDNKGLDSNACNSFRAIPFILIYDLEKDEIKVIENQALSHEYGMCQPLQVLGQEVIDVLLVGKIGAGALEKFKETGIKIYQSVDRTVLENIEMFKRNELKEYIIEKICSHHKCGNE